MRFYLLDVFKDSVFEVQRFSGFDIKCFCVALSRFPKGYPRQCVSGFHLQICAVFGEICTDNPVVVTGAERFSTAGGDDLCADFGKPARPDGREGQPQGIQLGGVDFHGGHDWSDADCGIFLDPGAPGASLVVGACGEARGLPAEKQSGQPRCELCERRVNFVA